VTRRPIVLVTTALALGALGLAACGDDDTTTTGTQDQPRTIEIEMRDIAFSPDEVDVQAGETVRFVFTNTGAVRHDAFIGDEAAQDEHEMEMRGSGDMGDDNGGGHDSMSEEGGITVEPGESGEITHTFAEGDELLIGCHEPGHYEAGMRVMVNMT
jgi:uncharacterized cupredoxin-like copper-binding protein